MVGFTSAFIGLGSEAVRVREASSVTRMLRDCELTKLSSVRVANVSSESCPRICRAVMVYDTYCLVDYVSSSARQVKRATALT